MNKEKIITCALGLIILIGLVLTLTNRPEEANVFEDTAEEVSVTDSVNSEEFARLIDTGRYTVIDVRTPQEIADGKVYDPAMEIDFYDADFREQIASLPRDEEYLLYCRSGNRSGKTLELMKELGFEGTIHLDGGINDWRASGFSE